MPQPGGMTVDATVNPFMRMAETLTAVGISMLPVVTGAKTPAVKSWRRLSRTLPTPDVVSRMFEADNVGGLGVICGAVSGNLECLDFDQDGVAFAAWLALVEDAAPGLSARLCVQRTRSGGGRHVVYRSRDVAIPGSMKLARNMAGHTTIETRGEGAYFCAFPTPGYEVLRGDIASPPTVSSSEREALLLAARFLDEGAMPTERVFVPAGANGRRGDTWRPGDDFDRRGDVRSALLRHGWEYVRTIGSNEQWRRPGKTAGSASATLRSIRGIDLLYVFSANAAPFEADTAYTPFAVVALLDHGGDFPAAARALRREGYGGGAPVGSNRDDVSEASSTPTRINQAAAVALLNLAYQGRITTTDIAVGLSICSFMDRNGLCHPSRQAIGSRANIKKADTITEAINRLAAAGFIKVKRQQRRANLYLLIPPETGFQNTLKTQTQKS